MSKIGAVNLVVSEKKMRKVTKKSGEYKEGFFAGFVACKQRAIYEGYHKDIATPKGEADAREE